MKTKIYYIVKINKNRENLILYEYTSEEKALDEMESMKIWHGWELKTVDTLHKIQ